MHFLFWFRGPSLGTEASSRKGSMMHNISFLTEMSQSCSWAVCTGWILHTVITRPFWISWSPGAHFYPASTPQTPRGTALSAMESKSDDESVNSVCVCVSRVHPRRRKHNGIHAGENIQRCMHVPLLVRSGLLDWYMEILRTAEADKVVPSTCKKRMD